MTLHPDKSDAELYINEVGVADSHQRQGIAKSILEVLMRHAKELGCSEAWVLTDQDNDAAIGLYGSMDRAKRTDGVVMFEIPLVSRDD